jgi:5-methylthioadenosine/S-adenosylhomocysteine deaminase
MVARVRAAGGMPSLGLDVEPFVSAHMWREMQAALLFVRGWAVKGNAALGNAPFATMPLPSIEALRWATVGGARAFRMEDRIGTLSPGKKADLVMLRADDINLFPVHDPVQSVVELAGAGNVDTVIIDGVVRKRDGHLLFPADVLRTRMTELAESAARIMREGGIVDRALN